MTTTILPSTLLADPKTAKRKDGYLIRRRRQLKTYKLLRLQLTRRVRYQKSWVLRNLFHGRIVSYARARMGFYICGRTFCSVALTLFCWDYIKRDSFDQVLRIRMGPIKPWWSLLIIPGMMTYFWNYLKRFILFCACLRILSKILSVLGLLVSVLFLLMLSYIA